MSAAAIQAYELYADWCASHDETPYPPDDARLQRFFAEVPCAPATRKRRTRAIAQYWLEQSQTNTDPAGTEGASAAAVLISPDRRVRLPDELSQYEPYAHPKYRARALRARRDAWVLVLAGHLGLSRRAIQEIRAADISVFPSLAIYGRQLAVDPESAAACFRCATTRWFRVIGPASLGRHSEAQPFLLPANTHSGHDCAQGLDGSWRLASTLTPAIDRHGWVSHDALSLRSVSTIVQQSTFAQSPRKTDSSGRQAETPNRFDGATRNELAEAYSEVEQRLAAELQRTEELLTLSVATLEDVARLRTP